MTQLEGSGASRLLQMFKSDTTPVTLTLATITALPPEISIRVDGDSIDTPHEGIIVAEHLTEHKRTISFSDDATGHVDGFHGAGALRDLQITKKEMTIHCDLIEGDRVIVAIADDGQLVYVLDKAVT